MQASPHGQVEQHVVAHLAVVPDPSWGLCGTSGGAKGRSGADLSAGEAVLLLAALPLDVPFAWAAWAFSAWQVLTDLRALVAGVRPGPARQDVPEGAQEGREDLARPAAAKKRGRGPKVGV